MGETWTRRVTLLTNHGAALLVIARDPSVRLVDIAARVGMSYRRAQAVVRELEKDGFITRRRHGRRTFYEIHSDRQVARPLVTDEAPRVEVFLAMLERIPAA